MILDRSIMGRWKIPIGILGTSGKNIKTRLPAHGPLLIDKEVGAQAPPKLRIYTPTSQTQTRHRLTCHPAGRQAHAHPAPPKSLKSIPAHRDPRAPRPFPTSTTRHPRPSPPRNTTEMPPRARTQIPNSTTTWMAMTKYHIQSQSPSPISCRPRTSTPSSRS